VTLKEASDSGGIAEITVKHKKESDFYQKKKGKPLSTCRQRENGEEKEGLAHRTLYSRKVLTKKEFFQERPLKS